MSFVSPSRVKNSISGGGPDRGGAFLPLPASLILGDVDDDSLDTGLSHLLYVQVHCVMFEMSLCQCVNLPVRIKIILQV